MELARLKLSLIREARRLGAVALRVVDATADPRTRARLEASFARGDLRTWPYDAQYARVASTPSAIFPQAKRVVCIAVPYATPSSGTAAPPLSGRVSNYAWSAGGDYHRVVATILRELAASLDRFAGEAVTRVVCDTAPLAERARAAAAGVGWIGKHTNLISTQAGSYVFLGEILTSLELPVDKPLRKSCGGCVRCIVACPTGALRGDYTIDAHRCISDLTQRTDAIPADLRPLIGDWVWGCDLCQVVCPPNSRASVAGDAGFAPDGDRDRPSLVALLHLKSGTFKRRYAPSAMGWRGAAVLRRNAAVALGNSLDRAAVPYLIRALREDPHPMVRGHVAWALGRIGSPACRDALHSAAGTERHASVLREISSALERESGTPSRERPLEDV